MRLLSIRQNKAIISMSYNEWKIIGMKKGFLPTIRSAIRLSQNLLSEPA